MAKLQVKLRTGETREYEISHGFILGKDLFSAFLNKKGQAVISVCAELADNGTNLIDEIKIIRETKQ